jgi:large subunit ribosomal protein L33
MLSWFILKKFIILHLLKLKEMAKKSKEARGQVILECTEHKATGLPGTSRYITTKNKKNTPERLELKKYNPILKKMTVHKEIK